MRSRRLCRDAENVFRFAASISFFHDRYNLAIGLVLLPSPSGDILPENFNLSLSHIRGSLRFVIWIVGFINCETLAGTYSSTNP